MTTDGWDFSGGVVEVTAPPVSSEEGEGWDFSTSQSDSGWDFSSTPTKRTKEDILADPEAMATIRRGLTTMYGDRKSFIHTDFSDQDDEDIFETWQNWQRYFAAGNSVTTSRTAMKAFDGDDETKITLDENFRLFDSMESGLKGDFWDTVWDYTSGAVVDPLTVVSLGVGKAISQSGTKAGAVATRQALKQTTSAAAKQAVVRQGLAQAAKEGAKTAARYSAFDVAANLALDVAYQRTRMEVGTQEEYDPLQTGISVVASAGIPVILGAGSAANALSRSKAAEGTAFASYVDQLANEDLTATGLVKIIKEAAPKDEAQASVKNLFKGLKSDDVFNEVVTWRRVKEDLPDFFKKHGGRPKNDIEKAQLYVDQLLHGNANSKGFIGYLIDEKIPFDKQLFADEYGKGGTSAFIYNTLDLLDDATVAKMSDDFAESFGDGTLTLPRTVEELKNTFGDQVKISAENLGTVSKAERRLTSMRKQMANQADMEARAAKAGATYNWAQYGQGVWKRLLTSHPATTGANVMGWGTMYAMNSASDLAMGLVYLGEAALRGARGQGEAASAALQASKGSIIGALRRTQNLLQWDDTITAANKLLEDNPKYYKMLRQTRTGDSGPIDALEQFGLEGSKVARGTEAVAELAQSLTGVKLQDELTKSISFMSALDSIMLQRTGKTMGGVMSDVNYAKFLASEEFQDMLGYATDRAMRETASRSFSDFSPGRSFISSAATGIEKFSQAPVGGIMIPFGRFFNNTMAMAGDFSGVNLARHLIGKAKGKAIDTTTKDGRELLANAMVGWTLSGAHVAMGIDRLEKGMSWNQDERADGSVSDRTYDWPGSAFRLLGQLWAHRIKDGEVPPELAEEAMKIYVTQSLKDTDAALQTMGEILQAGYSLDVEGGSELMLDSMANTAARFISGGLRPLDPINEGVKFFRGTGEAKDRRENFSAQAFRYVDGIFGFEDQLETRYQPIGGQMPQDISKQSFGSRTAPDASLASNIANHLGVPLWKTVRWDGEPELKNRLDQMFSNHIELTVGQMLEDYPDFDKLTYEKRRELFDRAIKRAKKNTKYELKVSTENGDLVLNYYDKIAGLDKQDTDYVKQELGIEDDLIDLANDPSGWSQLDTILYLIKHRKRDILINQ